MARTELNSGLECHELNDLTGDVIYLNALGKQVVVLNSAQAAVDLLDKRSSNYSDRPRFVMFVEMSVRS
jgi:hypothetical protein